MTDNDFDHSPPSPELVERIRSLSIDDPMIAQLLTDSTEDEILLSVPLYAEDASLAGIWLHCRQKRTCWYIRAKHEYEAWVTEGSKDGPRIDVDVIELQIKRNIDSAAYTHRCERSSGCRRVDNVYATFGACGRSEFRACVRNKGYPYFCTNWTTLK